MARSTFRFSFLKHISCSRSLEIIDSIEPSSIIIRTLFLRPDLVTKYARNVCESALYLGTYVVCTTGISPESLVGKCVMCGGSTTALLCPFTLG